MNCKVTKDMLVSYMEGDLDAALKTEISRHIDGCADCRKELKLLSGSWQLLGSYEAPKVAESFTASLMERVRAEGLSPAHLSFNARAMVLASLALVAIGLTYYVWTSSMLPKAKSTDIAEKANQVVAESPIEPQMTTVPDTIEVPAAEPVRPVIEERPDTEPEVKTAQTVTESSPASVSEEDAWGEQAVIIYMKGTVKVLPKGDSLYRDAEEGMILLSGDTVTTGSDGVAELSYDPHSDEIIRVQSGTKATVTFEGSEKMMLYDGEVFATINTFRTHSAFEIRTPTAISGARGTAWTTKVDAGGTTVESIERTPYIKTIDVSGQASSVETSVDTGYFTVVRQHQAPLAPAPIAAERAAKYGSMNSEIRGRAADPARREEIRAKAREHRKSVEPRIAEARAKKAEGVREDRKPYGPGKDRPEMNKRVDANGDGVVNTEELMAWSGAPKEKSAGEGPDVKDRGDRPDKGAGNLQGGPAERVEPLKEASGAGSGKLDRNSGPVGNVPGVYGAAPRENDLPQSAGKAERPQQASGVFGVEKPRSAAPVENRRLAGMQNVKTDTVAGPVQAAQTVRGQGVKKAPNGQRPAGSRKSGPAPKGPRR